MWLRLCDCLPSLLLLLVPLKNKTQAKVKERANGLAVGEVFVRCAVGCFLFSGGKFLFTGRSFHIKCNTF